MQRLLASVALLVLALPSAFLGQNAVAFKESFIQAAKADDFAKQQELVTKTAPDTVVAGFVDLETDWCAIAAAESSAQEAFKYLEQLATVASITPPRTDFLTKRVAWLRELTPEQKQAKVELYSMIGQAYARYSEAMKSRTESAAMELVPTYIEVLAKAQSATDHYWGSQACWYLADLNQVVPNWFETCYWFKKAIEVGSQGHSAAEIAKKNIDAQLRRAAETGKVKPELVDVNLDVEASKAKYKEALLNVPGSPTNPTGAGGTGTGTAAPANSAATPPGKVPTAHTLPPEWKEVPIKVSKLAAEPSYVIPSYAYNSHVLFWFGVGLKRGEAKVAAMLPGAPELENDGGKLFLHPDGKGKTKDPIRLKLSGKPEVHEFKNVKYLDGSTGTVWHTVLQLPSTFSMGGFDFNYGEEALVMYRGASVAKGKFGDAEITVHDVNGNGAFNDFGQDVLVSGKGKAIRVQPLSKYVSIDGLFFEMTIEANGRMMRLRPYDGPIAPLKLDWKGSSKPRALIAQSSGDDTTYFYNLMDAIDHPVWVIPGAHHFYEGFMGEGKLDKATTIHITRGRSGAFPVEVAKENVWKFGGAGDQGFTFIFNPTTEGNEMVIDGKTIKIFGAAGEGYERSLLGVPSGVVQVRKAKTTGPIVGSEKLKKPELADIRETRDYMHFPKTVRMKKTWSGDYEVKIEGEHPILGKITSDWIAGS